MDDLYPGLGRPARTSPTSSTGCCDRSPAAVAGTYRRWDWVAGAWAETHSVEPAPLLVLEGVGSGSLGTADLVTVLVWVEATYDVRMARGIARDGAAFAPHWHRWAESEADHFAAHGTRERADLVLRT